MEPLGGTDRRVKAEQNPGELQPACLSLHPKATVCMKSLGYLSKQSLFRMGPGPRAWNTFSLVNECILVGIVSWAERSRSPIEHLPLNILQKV